MKNGRKRDNAASNRTDENGKKGTGRKVEMPDSLQNLIPGLTDTALTWAITALHLTSQFGNGIAK